MKLSKVYQEVMKNVPAEPLCRTTGELQGVIWAQWQNLVLFDVWVQEFDMKY